MVGFPLKSLGPMGAWPCRTVPISAEESYRCRAQPSLFGSKMRRLDVGVIKSSMGNPPPPRKMPVGMDHVSFAVALGTLREVSNLRKGMPKQTWQCV